VSASTPRERLAEAAELCTGNDHLYFDAIEQINDVVGRLFTVIDKAAESGRMPFAEHSLNGCMAGGAASQAIERILQLRQADIDIAGIPREIAKELPESANPEAAE
jgi:hypothetical protein